MSTLKDSIKQTTFSVENTILECSGDPVPIAKPKEDQAKRQNKELLKLQLCGPLQTTVKNLVIFDY